MGHFWMVLGVQRKLCTRAARCLTSEPCTALNLKFSDATQNQIGSGVSSLNEIERHTSSLALASKCPPGGNFGFVPADSRPKTEVEMQAQRVKELAEKKEWVNVPLALGRPQACRLEVWN